MADPFVTVSLIALAGAAGFLTVWVARGARRLPRARAYWTTGLALVAVTLALEVVFYSTGFVLWAVQLYLFLVAALVGLLSLGSVEVAPPGGWKGYYRAYIAAVIALCGAAAITEPSAPSILVGGVVSGPLPLGLAIASSLVTVPASLVMIGVSLYGAIRQRRTNLLYVAAGVIVISAAGGLYLASVPVTLYYAEFVGVILLAMGFLRLGVAPTAAPVEGATGP